MRCANDVDVSPGRLVYTQMLNACGGIEADLTVTRLADDAFVVVTSASASTHYATGSSGTWARRAPSSPT
jgi:sarcosine dehydrogenase